MTAPMSDKGRSSALIEASQPSTMSRPVKILIVDDHREVRTSLRRLLRRVPGLEFAEAESAKTAIAAVEEGADLMLLDIRLSDDPRDRSGLDVLRELRKLGRNVPAV